MTYPPDPDGTYRPPVDPFESPPSSHPPGGGYGGAPSPPPPSGPPQPSSPPPPTYVPGPSPYGQPPPPPQPPPQYGPGGGPPPYGPGGQPPPYLPGGAPPPFGPGGGPPRKSRRGLVIVGVVLAAALVLCGGGGVAAYLLTRDTDRGGADTATAAVDAFLQAVYRDQNPGRASELVCSEARDEGALAAKIDEIAAYEQDLNEPQFDWTGLSVVEETGDLAVVETTVTMTTADEKTADLGLRLSVLDKGSNGWWVCNLETVSAEAGAAPQPDDGSGEDEAADEEEENGG